MKRFMRNLSVYLHKAFKLRSISMSKFKHTVIVST